MTTTTEPLEGDRTTTGDDLDHLFCPCDRNVGLCGADLTAAEETTQIRAEVLCIVCVDLNRHKCSRCGR